MLVIVQVKLHMAYCWYKESAIEMYKTSFHFFYKVLAKHTICCQICKIALNTLLFKPS